MENESTDEVAWLLSTRTATSTKTQKLRDTTRCDGSTTHCLLSGQHADDSKCHVKKTCVGALSGTRGARVGRQQRPKQKTAERPTTRHAEPTRRFRCQFRLFFSRRRLWSSHREKHAAARCLLFRTLDFGHKQIGRRHI